MRGGLLDVVIGVAVLLFAFSGYRQGFLVGVLSFTGFLGGGVAGARIAPAVSRWEPVRGVDETLLGLAVVLFAAVVGQLLAIALGRAVRARLTWHPARVLDALGGSLVSVVGVLLVAWLLGLAAASAPYPALASSVRGSAVLGAVDELVPDPARRSLDEVRALVDDGVPDVFSGLAPSRAVETDPPDPALTASALVRRARADVLRVGGTAPSCSRRSEGTGFAYAPERVMTNAHVVAGVRDPVVQPVGGRPLPARVVLFDPARDVAVLAVPGLRGRPLRFAARPANGGDSAVVLGYPQGGPFRADAARVRQVQRARGMDIYSDRSVVREVYALRGRVRPGNSGGPLLDIRGDVLGVVFAAAADRPDLGYALTAREVAGDATRGSAATAEVSTGECS